MRPWGRAGENVGTGERRIRAGVGVAFFLLAGMLPGRAAAWIIALLGLGLLATAWASY